MTITFEEMRKDPRWADPFRKPDWRYKRVLKMISRVPSPGRTTRRDDEYIKGARAFLLRWRKGENEREKLLYENPGMYHAWRIFDKIDKDPEVQFMVESRLLAGQNYEEIAHEVFTLPEAIEWYEKVFFNVREFLDRHDWITKHVLLPASDRFIAPEDDDDDDLSQQFKTPVVVRPYLDMTLKFFSYFGGPIICEYMISGFKRGMVCHKLDDIGDWLNEVFTGSIQRRSAQAAPVFEVNRYNVMELFSTHSRIIEIQSSQESEENRHSAIEKHIHSMLTEIPWLVGKEGKNIFEGTVIGNMDESAAELNSEELLLIGAGESVDNLPDIQDLTLDNREELEKKNATNPKRK